MAPEEEAEDVRARKEETALKVALAEYGGLQAQLGNHITAQYSLVGIALTAFGVVTGIALTKGGDRRLFLVIPPLAAMMSLIHQAMTYRALKVAVYIRDDLWPFFETLSGRSLPSWETFQEQLRHGDRVIVRSLLVDGPAIAVYFLASLASAIAVRHVGAGLHAIAWLLTVVTLVAPLIAPILARRLGTEDVRASTSTAADE